MNPVSKPGGLSVTLDDATVHDDSIVTGGGGESVTGYARQEMTLSAGHTLSLPAARAVAVRRAAIAFGSFPGRRVLLPASLVDELPVMFTSAVTLGGVVMLPQGDMPAAPGLFAKVLSKISPEPFAGIVTLDVVRNQFSTDAQKIINDRLNKYNSDDERENLRSLYENIKFYMLQNDSRQRDVTRIAIMKLALKFGLSVSNGDTRVTLYFEKRQDGAQDIIEKSDTEFNVTFAARNPVSDMLTLVRGLLIEDDAETAAAVFFARLADESTRAALMVERSVLVFGLLTNEEREILMSAAPTASDITDFARILLASAAEHRQREIDEKRLSRALAHGVETPVLQQVLQNLLMSDATRVVGFSLLATGLFYGDAKTANAFEEAYEVIPGKPANWYSGAEIYMTWKLHEAAAGSKTATTRLEGLYVHFARLTETTPPNVNDNRRVENSIKILAKLCPQVSVELRERIIEKLVFTYDNISQTHSKAVAFFVCNTIAKTLKSLRALIYDDDLILACDKIVINHDYGTEGELPLLVRGRFTDEKYLIECINARDERSMRALLALVYLRAIQKRTDLVGVNLNGFLIKPLGGERGNFCGFDFTGAEFDTDHATGMIIDGLGFKTLREGGRTDFTNFAAPDKQRWADKLEDVTISAAEMTKQIFAGCKRYKNVTITCYQHFDNSIAINTFPNAHSNALDGVELDNCRFVAQGAKAEDGSFDGARYLALDRKAYEGLRKSNISKFTHVNFTGTEMIEATLDGTTLTPVTFNSLYQLGRRKFTGIHFVVKDHGSDNFVVHNFIDISGCEFENCTFTMLGVFQGTKADTVALRSLKANGVTDIRTLVLDYETLWSESLAGFTLREDQVAGFYAKGRRDFSGADLTHVTFEFAKQSFPPRTPLVLDGCTLTVGSFFKLSPSSVLPTKLVRIQFVGKSREHLNLQGYTFADCQINKEQIAGAKLDKGSLESLKACGITDFTGCDLSHPSLVDADLNGCTIDIDALLAIFASGKRHFVGIHLVAANHIPSTDSAHYRLDVTFENSTFDESIWRRNINLSESTILSLKENGVTDVRGASLFITTTDCLSGLRIDREQIIHLPDRMRDKKARLNGVIIQDEDLSGLNLIGVEFNDCTVKNCKLDNAKVSRVTCETLLLCGITDFSMCEFGNHLWADAEINGMTVTKGQYEIMCRHGLRGYEAMPQATGKVRLVKKRATS